MRLLNPDCGDTVRSLVLGVADRPLRREPLICAVCGLEYEPGQQWRILTRVRTVNRTTANDEVAVHLDCLEEKEAHG